MKISAMEPFARLLAHLRATAPALAAAMEYLMRQLAHLRPLAPALVPGALFTLLLISFVEIRHSSWWQGIGYEIRVEEEAVTVVTASPPVVEANVKAFPTRNPPRNVTIRRHPWLRQGIRQYELMGFDYARECDDIDWGVYAAELRQRVELGYRVCGGSTMASLYINSCSCDISY
jgi:hypothetical protein